MQDSANWIVLAEEEKTLLECAEGFQPATIRQGNDAWNGGRVNEERKLKKDRERELELTTAKLTKKNDIFKSKREQKCDKVRTRAEVKKMWNHDWTEVKNEGKARR